MKKQDLLNYGVEIIAKFCELNNIKMPRIVEKNLSDGCGCYWYGSDEINICLKKCANETNNPGGFGWSHRGYFADREPAGVICHEFGHYLHWVLTRNKLKLEKSGPITSYEPNHHERFAETIKLFLLNPDLLKQYNPKRYKQLTKLGLKPVITTDWRTTLGTDVNPKFIKAAENKIRNNNK